MTKKILLGIIILLVIIQFFPIDKENPNGSPDQDFLVSESMPEGVKITFKEACYDCHSNHTKYPWYTNIAPLSWWINNHIQHGREELNFSNWTQYTEGKRKHKLEESFELIENGQMPLKSYTWMHPEAKLDDQRKKQVLAWLKEHMH